MRINWPFGVICLALGFGLGAVCFKSAKLEPRSPPSERRDIPVSAAPEPIQKPSRAWGTVEALKIPFADDQHIFPDREARMQPAQWFFENFSLAQLNEFLVACGLSPEEQAELRDHSRIEMATNGCLVHPSETFVRTLRSDLRGRIYSVLGKSEYNYAQRFPFRFAPDDFESRFDGSGLSVEKLAAIRTLTYSDQGDLCFADVQLLPQFLLPDEVERATEWLYRFPAYRLRLRLSTDSNVDALVKYWGRGGREDRIRPLISSLARVPKDGGAAINISYLLPSFARLRLYSFPNAWSDPDAGRQDCFWSSMNFFNDQPDAAFLKGDHVKEVLKTSYHLVRGEPKFGDLVTLLDRNGNGLHMCVYLADDFVFTKNGVNLLSPWVIMKTSDMLLLFFPSKEDRNFVIYRRNDLS